MARIKIDLERKHRAIESARDWYINGFSTKAVIKKIIEFYPEITKWTARTWAKAALQDIEVSDVKLDQRQNLDFGLAEERLLIVYNTAMNLVKTGETLDASRELRIALQSLNHLHVLQGLKNRRNKKEPKHPLNQIAIINQPTAAGHLEDMSTEDLMKLNQKKLPRYEDENVIEGELVPIGIQDANTSAD